MNFKHVYTPNTPRHYVSVIFVATVIVLLGYFTVRALLIFIPLVISDLPSATEKQQEEECIADGGTPKYIRVPPNKIFVCAYEYSDAGKTCNSNDQCEGKCLVTKNTVVSFKNNVFLGEIVGGTGECESTNYHEECSPPSFDNPSGLCPGHGD